MAPPPSNDLRSRLRRGVAYLLSMVFLLLISLLALGFFSMATSSVQVAGNDVDVTSSRLAAESGTAFMRYQMSKVNLPAGTTSANMITTVGTQLATILNGTSNLGGASIACSSTAINIPASTSQFITIDSSTKARFRADLDLSGNDVRVTITGRVGTSASQSSGRGVQLTYRAVPNDISVFNYGLATGGTVSLSGGILKGIPDASRGSFMSTATSASHPLTMSGSAVVSGKVYFTNPSGTVSGSGSINGTTNSALWNVQTGVAAPEFPVVDTTAYLSYLNSAGATVISASTSATPLSNIRIKAGTNPTLSGGGTINGLIYIEAPNKVTFSGGTNITGVIVVDNPNEGTSTNAITFSGGGTMLGPENLPASYGALRSMTGASILAPNFAVNMTGGSASFGGSMLVKSIGLSGGSGGSVNGTVISYGTASTTFSGGSGFTFTNTGPAALPTTGLSFTGHLTPISSTYNEVH